MSGRTHIPDNVLKDLWGAGVHFLAISVTDQRESEAEEEKEKAWDDERNNSTFSFFLFLKDWTAKYKW